jgi:1-deoxy-D-xylulose-5-phosphate synthase
VYSTFLQRAYDQIIHDVCTYPLHVVFAIDRAGISGEDGETHQGLFDAAFLAAVPNMTVLCPSNERELRAALHIAVQEMDSPVAIRYPKGSGGALSENYMDASAALLRRDDGARVTLVSYGTIINNALCAAEILSARGIACEVVKLNYIKPLPVELVRESVNRTGLCAIVEDGAENGGVGQRFAAALTGQRVILRNAGDAFLRHGSVAELQRMLGLDGEGIAEFVFDEFQ